MAPTSPPLKTGLLLSNRRSNQVCLMPKPNQTINRALPKEPQETWRSYLNKCKASANLWFVEMCIANIYSGDDVVNKNKNWFLSGGGFIKSCTVINKRQPAVGYWQNIKTQVSFLINHWLCSEEALNLSWQADSFTAERSFAVTWIGSCQRGNRDSG